MEFSHLSLLKHLLLPADDTVQNAAELRHLYTLQMYALEPEERAQLWE